MDKLLAAAAMATAGVVGIGTARSHASLIIDIRAVPAGIGGATGTSAGVLVSAGGKSIILSSIGQQVRFDIFARVSGTDGNVNNEALQSLSASFNTSRDIKGNMSLPAGTGNNQMGPVIPFRDSGFQNGALQDWDSDGDIDLGSGQDETVVGKFLAHSAAPISSERDTVNNPNGSHWSTIDANTSEIRIGRFLWTYTAAGGDFVLDFKERLEQSGARWFQDGSPIAFDQSNGNVASNGPVTFSIPEPASLGLLALTALGLQRVRKT